MLSRAIALSAITLLLLGCKKEEQPEDAGIDMSVDVGGGEARGPEFRKPDATAVKPRIKSITPSSGFSDKTTPVVLIGEHFAQGMAVYIDGQPLHGVVTVASSATAQFTMPVNPYDTKKPQEVTVQVLVNKAMSELVKFRYIVATPMSKAFHGVIVTPSVLAKRYILSPPIEGKVLAQATDAGAAQPEAEVGYGPEGSNPSTDGGWVWMTVPFDRKEGEYSFFKGGVRFMKEGKYDLAFRFSRGDGYFIFADKDDIDLIYSPAQAAKLTVEIPPEFYCEANEDCAPYPVRSLCNVAKKTCVECLAESDCTANPYSSGPKCDTAANKCYCVEDAQCVTNPNGAVCNKKPKGYCGCQTDKNCVAPKTCVETPPEGEPKLCS